MFVDFFHSKRFVEFLRFLYSNEVRLSGDTAIKLFKFADKYLQNDLIERCLGFLIENINLENVYTILDFARLEEVENLESWCLKFLKDNINVKNISELITYLNKQAQENIELRDYALDFILNNYAKIHQNADELYDDFLIRNVTIENCLKFFDLIERVGSQKTATSLRKALLHFVEKNFEQLKEKQIVNSFSKEFWADFVSYQIDTKSMLRIENEHLHQRIAELGGEKHISDTKSKNGLKRMESAKKDDDNNDSDEKPTLKKTKNLLLRNKWG